MESNKNLIGKQYPQTWQAISAQTARDYAAATDDPNPHYANVVPPMAVVTVTIPHGVAHIVQDNELIGDPLRLLRLLHTEEDITWYRPLQHGEELGATSTLVAVEERPAGEVLRVRTDVVGRDGQPAAQTLTTMMIRQRNPGAPRRDDHARPAPPPNPEWSMTWRVAPDQSERYARASGDHNPIHLDDDIARQAHLKGRILHGLCTMAFAQRAIVTQYGGGAPGQLRRLRVRFSRPVLMGDELTCACHRPAAGEVAFVVKNQEGQMVLAEGAASVGAS